MATTINNHWALIESVGYTIQRGLGDNYPAQRFEAVPLHESIEREIAFAIGEEITTPAGYKCPGADLSERAFAALARVRTRQYLSILRENCCEDCCREYCSGLLCIECATEMFTPESVRALNGEAAWAAARKGSALDGAMAEIIVATPEIERLALAALIPATPTPTRRQSGRL